MNEEDAADRILRHRTELATDRTRAPVPIGDTSIVANWKCRTSTCAVIVAVPASAFDAWEVFNRKLASQRQPPIATDQVMFCDACAAELRRSAPERRRAQDERLAPVVKLLAASPQPEREHAMIRQLRQWGHPDVDGLVGVLKERKRSRGGAL